ncbi:MAG: hypothetical protein IKP02_06945 [Paludibacteraceae bacterium]|nr:hypothetical protein [Paludibacteraceae bacterium]
MKNIKIIYEFHKTMPAEQLTPEFKAVLATYGQQMDYVDLSTLAPIVDLMV